MDDVLIYTRSQIRENRLKWINFLLSKGRKKATEQLDKGGGSRCCLGHGCYILGIRPDKLSVGGYDYDGESDIAPASFIEMVGLWDATGCTRFGTPIENFTEEGCSLVVDLAGVNDNTDATPQQIGEYILSVIEGGDDTPFKPLADYPV